MKIIWEVDDLKKGRRFNISSMGLSAYATDVYGRNFIISMEEAHVVSFRNRHEVVDWLNRMEATPAAPLDILEDEKNQIDNKGDDDND